MACRKVSDDEFDKEVKYSVLVSKLDIGPKVYKSWKCENVESKIHKELLNIKEIKMGFILMEKLDITLIDYISNYELTDKLLILLRSMYEKLIKNGK